MAKLPDQVSKAWDERSGFSIFATVDENDVPNIIYVTCVSKFNDETIVIADNYFDKTKKNILSGSKASILFATKDVKAYQIKGSLQYFIDGEIFDDMKKWNPKEHPGHAAVALKVEEVYSGGEKLL